MCFFLPISHMAQPTVLKVVQVCSVAPLQGTTPSSTPTSLPLTFFDLLWLRFPPVECLFFFEFPHSPTCFFDSVVPTLKHSLSLTLQHFLPLAGNITWPLHSPYPIINYVPGDVVSFTVAESNANFNLLSSDLCEAAELHPLIPHLTTSHEQASVMTLQLTVFPNSGFCIGMTIHHAALDGKSTISFMESWLYACSKLGESPSLSLPEHLTPSFERSVIRDPSGITKACLDALLEHGGPNNRSLKVRESRITVQTGRIKGLFELTPLHIQKLKQYALSKLKLEVQPSTFSVTCAYVWACLVKAQPPKANRVVLMFPIDCRSRLDPPISPMYFGNCLVGQRVVAETKNLIEKDGFIIVLEGINEALDRVKNGVLSGLETRVSNMYKVTEDQKYSIAGSPRFEVYSVDFGWGRPKKVDITSIDKPGAFSLSENRNNNGGVEIGLVLNKQEMEAFSALFVQGLESF